MKRLVLIVLDSLGIGAAKDANIYNDEGSNTLGHILKKTQISIPNLTKLGITQNLSPQTIGSFGYAEEISKGKGTIEGHWEIAGIETKTAFQTFPDGFPQEMLDLIKKETGLEVLANIPASGTEIIKEYGDLHMQTGKPIVYTSADSVFQVACHEETFGLENLYQFCEEVRKILNKKWNVSRVIARPFIGSHGNFTRTSNRKDFSIYPPENNLLNLLLANGVNTVSIGKIKDIFCGEGIASSVHTVSNTDGINKIISLTSQRPTQNEFVFANLVDFDMLYGHRRDVNGYANAILEFDNALPEIINNIKDNDLLIITADHGCDPTFKGTDHTRENIPILIYGKNIKTVNIGKRNTFADIGATISRYFNCPNLKIGTSFLNQVIEYEQILREEILQVLPEIPETVVVLGSGLGEFKNSIKVLKEIAYDKISSVIGHGNSLLIGTVNNIPILAMNGRFHYYEGYKMEEIAAPIKLFKKLGVKNIVLSAAVGSLYKKYKPGTIITITDHIKFFDESPIRGLTVDDFGSRFPDMTNAYKYKYIEEDLSKYMENELKIPYITGVYSYMPGPQYETPAEIKALKVLGATVTGMSTVPEVITAVYCGINVFAFGAITNYAAGITDAPLNHTEVIEVGKHIAKNFSAVITKTIELIYQKNKKG